MCVYEFLQCVLAVLFGLVGFRWNDLKSGSSIPLIYANDR